MPFPLPIYVSVRPTILSFQPFDRQPLLLIQMQVVPPHEETQEDLRREENKDGYLPRKVARCVFGLKGLGSNNVCYAKGCKRHSVDRHFLRVATRVARVVSIDLGER